MKILKILFQEVDAFVLNLVETRESFRSVSFLNFLCSVHCTKRLKYLFEFSFIFAQLFEKKKNKKKNAESQ